MMREVPCSGPQAGQGPTIADNGDRAAGKVSDGGILEVDAQMTVNGGQQIAGVQAVFHDIFPLAIGRPEDLSRRHETAANAVLDVSFHHATDTPAPPGPRPRQTPPLRPSPCRAPKERIALGPQLMVGVVGHRRSICVEEKPPSALSFVPSRWIRGLVTARVTSMSNSVRFMMTCNRAVRMRLDPPEPVATRWPPAVLNQAGSHHGCHPLILCPQVKSTDIQILFTQHVVQHDCP